jgi:hypothetical protein
MPSHVAERTKRFLILKLPMEPGSNSFDSISLLPEPEYGRIVQ